MFLDSKHLVNKDIQRWEHKEACQGRRQFPKQRPLKARYQPGEKDGPLDFRVEVPSTETVKEERNKEFQSYSQ